jgi:hypothetical protein
MTDEALSAGAREWLTLLEKKLREECRTGTIITPT